MQESLDYVSPILPMDFFAITGDLHPAIWGEALKKKHTLPEFSELLYEDPFAQVQLGWSSKGLIWEIHCEKPFEEAFYPQYGKGDSIELFVDTRDLKTQGFINRFCHHFVILPKAVDGVRAAEITRFRTDDKHELCDPDLIKIDADFGKRAYSLRIALPKECLFGYDPAQFDRIGIAYRINGTDRKSQHFAKSSNYLTIESLASQWTSMHMRDA